MSSARAARGSTMTEPKDAAAVRFPPPLIPLATILLGVGLAHLWPLDPGFEPSGLVRWTVGGAMMAGALLGIGLPAVVLFRRSGQSEIPWTPTPRIEESGPFRYTRNPMYLQMLIVCIGFAVGLWNAWILLLTPPCAWLLQRFAIEPEEAYLEREFGEGYRAYKRRVRRWL